jgi:hypothetical protein
LAAADEHGELKKNANTNDTGAQRRAEKQRQREETEERQRESERCNTRGAVKSKPEMSARFKADFLQQNLHL